MTTRLVKLIKGGAKVVRHARYVIFQMRRWRWRRRWSRRSWPGYDHLDERCFDFVPLWNIAVIPVYAMRWVNCSRCGVTIEQVPGAYGKMPMTVAMQVFLARGDRRLSGQ